MSDPIDYATPAARNRTPASAAVSLGLGLFALAMNALFWEGVFASEDAVLPLTAALITAVLPIVGIVTGLNAGIRYGIAVAGILCSFGSVAVSIGLLTYFLTHLPVC